MPSVCYWEAGSIEKLCSEAHGVEAKPAVCLVKLISKHPPGSVFCLCEKLAVLGIGFSNYRFLFEPDSSLLYLLFIELFDNYMQQDAHEFLNYLLNTVADILQEESKQEKQNGRLPNGSIDSENNNSPSDPTWVHEIFQGTLTNETRCLTCETVSLHV